jgi:hypothetical protein
MGRAKTRRQAEMARAAATAQVSSARIAIIEWLSENERHTETELKERLEKRSAHQLPTEPHLCRTKDDVFRAIEAIMHGVPQCVRCRLRMRMVRGTWHEATRQQ